MVGVVAEAPAERSLLFCTCLHFTPHDVLAYTVWGSEGRESWFVCGLSTRSP